MYIIDGILNLVLQAILIHTTTAIIFPIVLLCRTTNASTSSRTNIPNVTINTSSINIPNAATDTNIHNSTTNTLQYRYITVQY